MKNLLHKKLKSAFRYGSSAFRYGLVPEGISDHLPVTTKTTIEEEEIAIMSWNLLADEHLFNNFMNVSGSNILEADLNQELGGKENNIYSGTMYHLFAEISQFLIAQKKKEIVVEEKILKEFRQIASQPSRRALSRNPDIAKERTQKVELARNKLVEILLNTKHKNHHEHKLAIKHSMELIYHIKEDKGALKWQNRLKRLIDNRKLVKEIREQDIIALQECTNPEDIKQLLSENMEIHVHNVKGNDKSTDNVVVAFNKKKFFFVEKLGENFEGKKPALYVKLKHLQSGQDFVFGSIHHPGGEHDFRQKIMDDANKLIKDADIPFIIAGDYNHTKEQFVETFSEIIHYPDSGTMAGSDYNNTNKAIDGFLSNQTLQVNTSNLMQRSKPAVTELNVVFKLNNHQTEYIVEPSLLPASLCTNFPFQPMQINTAFSTLHHDEELAIRQNLSI